MSNKTASIDKKEIFKSVASKSKKTVATKTKTPVVKKSGSKKSVAVQPTLTAYIEFRSRLTGEYVVRKYEVTKADINDVKWYGGDCGDYFFDNEFETNEARFEQRLEDWIQYLMWVTDDDGQPVDPDLKGDHPDGLEYEGFVAPEWSSDFEIEDFYPV